MPGNSKEYRKLTNEKGFTIITVIIILMLLGVATGTATLFIERLLTTRRELTTEEELKALKEAIIGNPIRVTKQGRVDFGYLGHMGNLPATLQDLYIKGSQPDYALDTTAHLGVGWSGPYISPLLIEDIPALLLDSFGNTYEYDTTEYTRADGEVVSAKILSYGADKTSGTGDDKQVEILHREIYSTVSGYVTNVSRNGIHGAMVILYYPSGGAINNVSTVSGVDGLFQFTNVPYGPKTIRVIGPTPVPSLRYVEGSALAIGAQKNDLTFNITNLGGSAVTLTSIRLDYSKQGYYEQVYVGSNLVFKYDEPPPLGNNGTRGASTDNITFSSPITILGGGYWTQSLIRTIINSDIVRLPDIVLYPRGGNTLNIRYVNFKDTASGLGDPVGIDGEGFTVTLSNGYQFSLTAWAGG